MDNPSGGSDNDLKDAPVGDTDNRGSDGLKDQPRGGTLGAVKDLSPPSFGTNVFWLGNSLLGTPDGGGGVNCSVGYMVGQIADSLGVTGYTFKRQTINGYSMMGHWNTGGPSPDDADVEVPSGDYNVFIMQEMIPIKKFRDFGNSVLYTGNWHDLYTGSRSSGRSIFLGTFSAYWDDGTNGTAGEDFTAPRDVWSYRITDDEATWQSVVDSVNNDVSRASQPFPVELVYIGKKYMLSLEAAMPLTGFTNFIDMWRNGTHPDTELFYFMALAMTAELFDIDVRGAAYSFDSEGSLDGTPMNGLPGATLAGELQQIVYDEWSA